MWTVSGGRKEGFLFLDGRDLNIFTHGPGRSMNGGRDAPVKVGDGGSRVRVGRRAASKWGELFYRPERQA